MSVKPWWEIAVPHKDIREGRISDFAADLNSIIKGEAPVEYLDPEIFLKRTHLTKGLENIAKDVLHVLSGKEKYKIIQVQTPFGGGKTHALVYLYHLIKAGEKVSYITDVKKVLKAVGLTKVPKAKVAVFVGTVPDPLKGKTPWGEIASQLGAYEEVKEHDEKRVTPGREILERIFAKSKPVLILMDEIAEYTVKARDFEDQVFAFCQELTEAVKASDQCVLLCTLPSSAPYGERGEKVLNQLQRIFGRMQMIYTPVEGMEIYEILRKRLFEDLGDEKSHRAVARDYFNMYKSLGDEVPTETHEKPYEEKLLKAYPFHPELIDVLFERWGTIPTFQRTRGVLKLLAEVISDIFTRQHPAPLIQPAQINLANPRIRRMFIEHIGELFESVVASDIAGEDAKAVRIDRHMGTEYAKFKVASGLATCIFFYSFSGAEKKGATVQRLRLAFLREGIPSAIVGDALRRLEDIDGPLYLHVDRGLYYFSSKVGLNRLIVEREETIREEEVEDEVKRRVKEVAGTDFDIYIWPSSNSDIPDNKKLKLIILSPDLTTKQPETGKFVQSILTYHSIEFRTYKNTLMFLIAEPGECDAFRKTARRFLALKAIKADKEKMKTLTEEDKKRVDERLKDADSSLWFKAVSVYRYLAKGTREGFTTFDMGIPTVGELTISRRVKNHLKDEEILLEKLSPKALLEKTFSKDDESKSLGDMLEAFFKYPELPMLESVDVLKSTVAQGVQTGLLGVKIGEKDIRYLKPVSKDELTEDTLILRPEVAKEMVKEAGEAPPVPPTGPGAEVTGPTPPTPQGAIKRIRLKAKVPWDRLSDMLRGVLIPLNREGAQIFLEIKLEAQSDAGISRDVLDLKIKETLNQIGAEVIEEESE